MKLAIAILLTFFTLTLSAQEKLTTSTQEKFYKHIGYDDFDRPIVGYREYSLEGYLIQEGEYVNGKPNGIWKMYKPNGEVLSTMKFNNGDRVWLKFKRKGRQTIVYYENNLAYKTVAYLR